jgi:hypothetical protein
MALQPYALASNGNVEMAEGPLGSGVSIETLSSTS